MNENSSLSPQGQAIGMLQLFLPICIWHQALAQNSAPFSPIQHKRKSSSDSKAATLQNDLLKASQIQLGYRDGRAHSVLAESLAEQVSQIYYSLKVVHCAVVQRPRSPKLSCITMPGDFRRQVVGRTHPDCAPGPRRLSRPNGTCPSLSGPCWFLAEHFHALRLLWLWVNCITIRPQPHPWPSGPSTLPKANATANLF